MAVEPHYRRAEVSPAAQKAAGASPRMVVPSAAPSALYDVSARKIWAFVKQQPASYWLVVAYLFLEYIRPQQIYEPIKGWPLPLWAIVLSGVALLLEGRIIRKWILLDTLLLLFTGVVLISSINAVSPGVAFKALPDYLSWVVIYLLITSAVNTERRFLVFVLAFLLFSTKMSQHGVRSWMAGGFGFQSIGVTCTPGFFQNSGECGIQMAMFFPVSLFFIGSLRAYWPRWKLLLFLFMPLSAAVTMVASSSRGALLGLGAVLLWLALRQAARLRVRTVLGTALFAGVVAILVPQAQRERLRDMGEDQTSVSRLTYWRDAREIIREYPVLGIGYNNWLSYYVSRYNPNGQLVHNIYYQAAAELGYTGLGAFVLLIGGTFAVNRRTRRLLKVLPPRNQGFMRGMASGLDGALIGYLVAGMFVTVLYYPFFWINLAMTTALHASAASAAARAGVAGDQHSSRVMLTGHTRG